MVLEKTLESSLDCKEIQSTLQEISSEYSLEGLMRKLKLQYFGHLMQRTESFEKTLMLEKIEGVKRRRKGGRTLKRDERGQQENIVKRSLSREFTSQRNYAEN